MCFEFLKLSSPRPILFDVFRHAVNHLIQKDDVLSTATGRKHAGAPHPPLDLRSTSVLGTLDPPRLRDHDDSRSRQHPASAVSG